MRKGMTKHRAAKTVQPLMDETAPFQVAESYKTLRTNLVFSLAGIPVRERNNVVIVSSSLPGEGKSTTCANLALSMAQKNEKVLIVDADLRKPTQNRIFKVGNETGLSEALISGETDGVIYGSIRPRLDLLTSGPQPPNPSELLASHAMSEILDALAAVYDYVFIDTPPVNVVTDALVLSPQASGILLVIDPNTVTHEELQSALESIEMSGARLLGSVLTNLRGESLQSSGRSKRYSYAAAYGYSGESQT